MEKNTFRGFYRLHKAWYHKASKDENESVMFGIYVRDDGCIGEMEMRWKELGGQMVPQLRCFDDAFDVLKSFSDLLDKLGLVHNKNITEEEFCGILKQHGFEDTTVYENPHKDQDEAGEEFVTVKLPKELAEKLRYIGKWSDNE